MNEEELEFDKIRKEKRKSYNRQWYLKNKNHVKIQGKKYKELNKEKIKAQGKQYRLENKDKIKAYTKSNMDWIRERSLKYKEKNKERIKEYENKNSERIKNNARKRREANSEKYKVIAHAAHTVRIAIKKGILCKPLKCSICDKESPKYRILYHHHKSYAKENLLDVIPLCQSCHGREHVKMKYLENNI